MKQILQQIEDGFQSNLEKIETLLAFDELLQQICLSGLNKAKKGLDKFTIDNPRFSVDTTIETIKNIRKNASMKSNYEIMYNQCIVLLVSYFSSVLEDVFKEAFNEKMRHDDIGELKKEGFKITLEEWRTADIADTFVHKKDDINFQDMKSTLRSFEDYIGLSRIERNVVIDNIILAQAMRHCIVHSGCAISDKTINQLRDVEKRTVKANISKDESVQFCEDEVLQIMADMLSFVKLLSNNVLGTLKEKTETATHKRKPTANR